MGVKETVWRQSMISEEREMRGLGEGCQNKKGGANKPSGSELSLWTTCFRGQQKIS